MKKLYFNKEEREFYFVTKRPKSILVEWAENKSPESYNSDGEILTYNILDQNVKWKKLTVSTCGKNKRHCLRVFNEDYILIYPYQSGQPFCLEPAKIEDIEYEINICKKRGISYEYEKNLKISLKN